MKTVIHRLLLGALVACASASVMLTPVSEAAGRGGGDGAHRGGGGGAHQGGGGAGREHAQVNNSRADVRTNNVRNTSVNHVDRSNVNVNRNRNTNVNVDVDRHGGCCGWDNDYHPIATAAAVTATVAVTSAVVGSIVRSVPPGCVPVNYGGLVYQQCGATWYQPQGGQYVVISPPY